MLVFSNKSIKDVFVLTNIHPHMNPPEEAFVLRNQRLWCLGPGGCRPRPRLFHHTFLSCKLGRAHARQPQSGGTTVTTSQCGTTVSTSRCGTNVSTSRCGTTVPTSQCKQTNKKRLTNQPTNQPTNQRSKQAGNQTNNQTTTQQESHLKTRTTPCKIN